MTLRIILITFILLRLTNMSQADDLDIYILTGQSNSLGTTEIEVGPYDPGTHEADNQTHFFWSNPSAIGSANPNKIKLLGDSGGKIKTLQMQQGRDVNPTFWGPEMGMARTLFDSGKTNVMILKVSRGGGGNGFWVPKTGHMANHLIKQIDVALNAAQKDGHTFKVKGFMYLQGESNNSSEGTVADKRLKLLIDTVQNHINTIFSNAATGMYTVIGEIAVSDTNSARKQTTDLQKSLAKNSKMITFIRTRDIPLKKDNLHFGRDSKLEIGRRYADAFNSQSWVENPNLLAGYSANEGSINSIPHPLAQGLTVNGIVSDVESNGVNDNGIPAWRIADNNPKANPEYRQSLSSPDFKKMFQQGWIFKVKAKVISESGLALWSITKANDPGWKITRDRHMNGFVLKRVNGDQLEVGLWQGNTTINLGSGSANIYHTFELRGVAGASLFDFYVDNQLKKSGIDLRSSAGLNSFDDALIFNSGSGEGIGLEVYWNEVSLTAISK